MSIKTLIIGATCLGAVFTCQAAFATDFYAGIAGGTQFSSKLKTNATQLKYENKPTRICICRPASRCDAC